MVPGSGRERRLCLSEYVQFAGAMILFVGILVGSYFFVLTSLSARENESRSGRERGDG
jgi:hypothetical protein